MALPDVTAADVGLIGLYLVLLLLPGGIVAAAGGRRGWQLVASAPLLTYAVVGLTGPWTTALGIRWSPAVMAGGVVVTAAAAAGVRATVGRRKDTQPPPPGPRVRGADLGLAAAVAVAAAFGAVAVLGGIRRLTAIPQDWDAVFHANGIRFIADTGDAGLFGMSQVNWYEPGTEIFYPNAYHLLAAVLRQLTGQDLPSILNAHTALIPGLAALVLAALVRRSGGSAVHAAGTALAAVAVSAVYDMLWRGPLLPYATGVALTPVFVLLLADFLDAGSARDRRSTGLLLALGIGGLVCLHPSMLFGAAVFAVGYLGRRWWRHPAALRREPLLLLGVGVAGLALSFLQVSGSLYSAASFPPVDWAADLSWSESTLQLLTFSHAATTMQVWPTVFAAVGLLAYRRLGELRWIGFPALVFGVLFVLAASSDAGWVNALTRPWWNDRFRLAGVFALTLCVLIGHGLAQAHRLGLAMSRHLMHRAAISEGTVRRVAPAATAVLVLAAFVGGGNALYLGRNETKMSQNTGDGPAVSAGEVAAMQVLGRLVPPGARVLNDRNDGSAWMYALAGARPVAGHYDATGLGGTDVTTLEGRFNQYAQDPAVRDAAERLDVEYVMVGEGFLRDSSARAAGLTDLAGAPFLVPVYRNEDAAVYRLAGIDGRHPVAGPAGG